MNLLPIPYANPVCKVQVLEFQKVLMNEPLNDKLHKVSWWKINNNRTSRRTGFTANSPCTWSYSVNVAPGSLVIALRP